MKKSRGLRNNNPGNIRRSATRYRGEVESNDTAFKSFESMPMGYRAMFVLLHTYNIKHGLRSIAEMIARSMERRAAKTGKMPLMTTFSVYNLKRNNEFDYSKAARELGYTTRALDVTLRDQIKWLKENNLI